MKLVRPDLGGTPALRSESPSLAAQEGRQIQYGMESIAQAGRAATTYFKELENDRASTEMSLAFSKKMNELNEFGEFISADQARELGVEDEDMITDAKGEDREEIPIWEILPEYTKKQYDELTEEFGSQISGSGNRQRWINARRQKAQEYYDKLDASRREQRFLREIARQEEAIDDAVQLQDYNLARSLAAGHPDPEKRLQLVQDVNKAEEVAVVNEAYLSGDPQAMEDVIKSLNNKEYAGQLETVERTSYVNMLRAEQSRISAAANTKRFMEFENMQKQYEVLKALEDPRAFEALNQMEKLLLDNNMYDYKGKGWFAEELGSLTKIFKDSNDMAWVGPAFIAGDYAALDSTDTDQIDAVNKFVDQYIAMAEESGDPTKIAQTHAFFADSAVKTGIMPKVHKEMIRDLAQPNISLEDIRQYGAIYNQYATSGHPNLLKDLSDKDRLIAKEVFLASRAGANMEDAVRDIHARYSMMSEDAIEQREREFANIEDSQHNVLKTQLESRLKSWIAKVPGVSSVFRGLMKESFAEIGFQDQQDYNQLVRHYMLNGADEDVALEVAFETWAANHTISQVNGRTQRMRMAPEIMYGLESEDIRENLNSYVKSAIEAEDYIESGEYQIYPDMITLSEAQPSYVVFHEDDNGMIDMVMDDEGNVLRYRPDKNKIIREKTRVETEEAKRMQTLGMDKYRIEKLLEEEETDPLAVETLQGNRDGSTWEENMARSKAAKERKIEQSRLQVIDERSREIAEERTILEDLYKQ
jgi:hypothetical protein